MKKTLAALLKKFGLSLCVAAAAFVWSTCEVGLGEAVDTMAPTVSVTSPSASSVCAKAVKIEGTCFDDKGIAKVSIVVTNTKTGAVHTYYADIKNMTSWSKTINELAENFGYPLPDGSYTADVTATDVFGRNSGTSSTAFDIDNTEPIFCVTSPSSLDISDPRKYGRAVSISGEIADDHDIANMKIRVFRTDASGTSSVEITDKLAKTEFTDFETAGGTTVYIAKYFDADPAATNADGSENPDYKLYKNYMAIYDGVTLGQDVFIYVVPTLTDIAGNTSKQSYVSTEMKKIIANLFGVELNIDSLQTAQLMKIYNGTYNLKEFNQEQREKIVSIMNGTYALQPGDKPYYCYYDDSDASKRSPFAATVNSNNSPTYDFNGYENPTTSAEGWVGVNTGGTITITLKAGLDGWGILPSSLEVNLYECDDHGTKTTGDIAFSSNPFKDPTSVATVFIKDATNTETQNIATSVINQSYYVTLPSLKAGNRYILEAEGKDENDSGLVPVGGNWYGFKVASAITPPSFSCSDLLYMNGSALSAGDGFKLKLNIKDESDKIQTNGIKITGYLYDKHIPGKSYIKNYAAPAGVVKEYNGTSAAPIHEDATANFYYIDLPLKDFDFGSSVSSGNNYSIVLEAQGYYFDENNVKVLSSPATYMVWVDAAAPAITIGSPKVGETLITESFASYESVGEGALKRTSITPTGNWSDLDGSSTHRLWYTVDDDAAPSLSWQAASGTYVRGTNYYERQVEGQDCYALLDTDNFVAGATSVDGYYTLSLAPSVAGKTWTEITEGVSQVASQTTWEQKINVVEGSEKIFRVVGVDAVGNLSAVVQRTGLKYDFEKPKITLDSEPASNGYYNAANATGGKLTVEFTATDSYKIDASDVNVAATKNGAAAANGTSGYTCVIEQAKDALGNDNPRAVKVTITLTSGGTSDGEWKWTVSANDAAGRAAQSYELGRIVDTVAPSFEVFPDTEPAAIKGKKIVVGSGDKSTWKDWNGAWHSSTGLVFNGNFKEETSGLAKVLYTLLPAGATQELNGEKTRAGEKGSLVPFSLTVTSFEQSVRSDTGVLTSNILNISVTDKAGNVSGKEILTIDIDQSQPLFAAAWYTYVANPAASDLAAAEGTLVSDGTKDMTVYGTVSSPLSGVAGLDWQITPAAGGAATDPAPTINYTAAALTDAASYASANWEDLGSGAVTDKSKVTGWRAVIAAAKLDAGDVYVTAKNVAEKAVKTQIFTIDKDVVAPTINLNTPDTMIASYNATAAGSSSTTPPTEKPDNTPVPTTSTSVNGTVKIAGNSDDEKELSATEVYWSLDGTASIDESRGVNPDHKISDTGTSIYNWNVAQYEFSKLNDDKTKFLFADGTEYTGTSQIVYIKVVATDKAHNKTISVYKYTVDPDSDRPKITFSAPDDLSAMLPTAYVLKKGSALLRGKVEDDDGLTGLKLWYNDNDEADASSADGLKWTELGLTSGVFEIFGDTSEHDGQHKLKFKVEDAKGTTFVTGDGSGTNNTWLRPKIHKAGTGASETFFGASDSDDCFVYIAIDTKKPAIENKSYFVGDSASASVNSSSKTLGLLGGKKDKFTLYFYAKDESGLDEENISFVFNGVTYKKTPASGQKPLTISPSTNLALPGYSLITVKDISVAGLPSGSNYAGTIKVTDNAGLENTDTIPVEVDNDAPELTIINPSQSSSQTVSGSVNAYGTVNGADSGTKLYYALTFEDDTHDTAAATTTPDDSVFKEIKQKSKLMWYVYFDGGASTEEETHAVTLNKYLIDNSATINHVTASEATIADGTFTKTGGVVIYLWARAEDDVGNVKTEHYKVLLDPQGDKPEVSFSYPAANGDTMGGEIKIYGGARSKDKTNPTIKAVFAQIITNSHEYKDASYTPPASGWGTLSYDPNAKKITEFTLKANDWTYLQAAGYLVYKMDGYPATQTPWTSSNTDADADKYGIPITPNGSSWSIKLNAKGELNPKAAEAGQEATTNLAAIRIQSYDGVHFSSAESRAFIVDSDTPQLRDLMLEQFGLNGTDDYATASREYVEDMYVTGKWFLTFTLNDGQAMGVVKIGKGNTAAAAESAKFTYLGLDGGVQKDYTDPTQSGANYGVVTRDTAGSDYKKLNVKYPLDTASGCGTQYVYVYYEDSSGKGGDQAAKTYKISYDNKAPTLAVEADEKYSFPETVQQSDGWYTIQSKVSEPKQGVTDQSGFERVAFYFTRGTGANEEIFDPMIKKGETGNRISTSGLTKKYGLYWKSQTVGRDANDLNVLTISADANIHIGGLAEIDGAVYRIMSIDGSKVTINGQPRKEATAALFAVANVVDNTIQESSYGERRVTDYGFGYDSPSNDDGDLMVEAVVNDNTDWTWSANIYSKNIADGAVNIHYVAFDKAGNWAQAGGENSEKTTVSDPPVVAATVANNRPRVANLYVGTDLNGNNAIDGSYNGATAGERDEWSAPYKASSLTWNQDTNNGTAVTDAVLGTATNAYLTAKGMTVIKPEILGGNGNIFYAYKFTNAAGTELAKGNNATAFITEAQTIANPMANESARLADITIQAGDWTTDTLRTGGIPDTGAASPHKVEFTFYDQTEGAPAYGETGFDTRSDLASATIYMAVSMADAEEPKATREDLFWKAKGVTDGEGNNNNSVAWEGSTPLGHIDLGADLPDIFKATGAAAYTDTKDGTTYPAAEMDRDSKASGKIVLRGKVSDNKMLYHIYLKIPAMSTNFGDAKNADPDFGYNDTYGYMAATYNASAGTWTTPVATDATLSSYGIKFTVTNSKVKASGHTADWEFVWDTSYINNVAAADVTVDVYASDQILTSAVDAGGAYTSLNGTAKYTAPAPQEKNVSGSTAATAGNKPDTLQIDVVPYITGLGTMLSGKGVNFARSALGHWPLWYRADSTTTPGSYKTAQEKFSVNGFNFAEGNGPLSDQSKTDSGYLVVESGAAGARVASLNNINNNEAKLSGTDYDNAYNRQPNGKNNDLLTDDVYVDVWQLNGKAAVPNTLKIETPTMKINPDNGMIGFAFRYGTANKQFAMPYGKNNSYQPWHTAADIQNSVTLAYDANGASFGTVAGGESGSGYSDFFSFNTSLWGPETGGTVGGSNRVRIEMTGQTGGKSMTPATYSGSYTGDYSNSTDSGSTVSANEKTKHQSPVIATYGTNVYLAYYDSFNEELRFRSSLGEDFGNGKKNVGNFIDQYTNYRSITQYNYTNCQIVAQKNTPVTGGEYVGLAAKAGAVAIVWYGQDNATGVYKLWYSYNSTPNTSRAGKINTQTAKDGDGWTVPKAVFADKGKTVSGEYCKVSFDGAGKAHIAAYDSASGDIWYAYLDNPADASSAVVCRVDANGTVGENLTLDVALDDTADAKSIPVIGYFSSSGNLPKIAKPKVAGSFADGAQNGKFTGAWEVSYVPTLSKVEQDNINVGVWKNASTGVIKDSTIGQSYYNTTDMTGGCYGNGTKNAVLGYRYTDSANASAGYIETAQLK